MPVAILRRKPVAQSSCNRWERASASTLATQRRVEAFVKAHGGQCSSGGLPVEQRTWEWRACPALPTFSKQRFCELLDLFDGVDEENEFHTIGIGDRQPKAYKNLSCNDRMILGVLKV